MKFKSVIYKWNKTAQDVCFLSGFFVFIVHVACMLCIFRGTLSGLYGKEHTCEQNYEQNHLLT